MKITPLFFVLIACIVSIRPAFASKKVFQKIASVAPVGNGSASIEKYNISTSLKKIQEESFQVFQGNGQWKDCGPWKTSTSRREAIALIEKLESDQESQITSTEIQKLYNEDKIIAIISAESRGGPECSLHFFNVFGADGSLLKLRYNMGD